MRFLPTLIVLASIASARGAAPTYQEDVRPILKEHCFSCHNPDKKKADLDLTSLAALLAGSSGGDIVQAGQPDNSPLFQSADHQEGFEPMPPKKPKLPKQALTTLHAWIAGGLIETKGGTSQLREVHFEVSAGSTERPENPAFPKNWPTVEPPSLPHSPPIVALAASPWVPLVAVGGHQHVYLYGPTLPATHHPGFTPEEGNALLGRWMGPCDPLHPSVRGNPFSGPPRALTEIPTDAISTNGAFSFCAWIRPESGKTSLNLFGRESMSLSLDPTSTGYRASAWSRGSANHVVKYRGTGNLPADSWSHLAVTSNGKEWIFYTDGTEINRVPAPEKAQGFLTRDVPFFLGGKHPADSAPFRGRMDDVRLYKQVLPPKAIARMAANGTPSWGTVGIHPFGEGGVSALSFSRNGDLLIVAGGLPGKSGRVQVIDILTGTVRATLGEEVDTILTADLSPDHRLLAIGTPLKKVKVFDVTTGALLYRKDSHTDWVTAVRFSPDGKQLASGDRNGGIHVWEAPTGGVNFALSGHKMQITSLDWRSDSHMLLSGSEDGNVVLWDMKDGFPARTIKAHNAKAPSRATRYTGVIGAAFRPDGSLFTTGRDRSLKWWKVDGRPDHARPDLPALPTRMALSTGLSIAGIGDSEGQVHLWDPQRQAYIRSLPSFTRPRP